MATPALGQLEIRRVAAGDLPYLMTPIHLCIVTHALTRNDGQGRINAEVAAAVGAAGHAVHVVATDVDADLLAVPGLVWHRVAIPQWLPTNLLRYQVFAAKAWRILRRLGDVDVLQLNGSIVYGVDGDVNVSMFVHADWLASPQHPWRTRGGANALYQYVFTRLNVAWERRAYGRAERVVALSDQVRDALVRHVGVPGHAIDVIKPGVDLGQFRPPRAGEANVLRAELGVGPEPFLMLFAGDIRSNRKNLDSVLRALRRLPGDVRLAVIGDDAWSPYPAMARELGLADRVTFLGRRTADVPALMRGADLFAFPSHYDTFALVVTEAMASGVPVVTAPTVGAADLIRDGENGFVLPTPNDEDLLVSIISDLYRDPDRRAAIGRAARQTAEQHSWDAMAAEYYQVYRTILADRGRTGAAGRSDPC